MEFLEKSDTDIFEIANPLWLDLVKASNKNDYGGFTKNFSETFLMGANEVEIGKQWANNKLLSTLKEEANPMGCLRRDDHITVIYKQKSTEFSGDYLGRLVLGLEHEVVKIFGATIFLMSKFKSTLYF